MPFDVFIETVISYTYIHKNNFPSQYIQVFVLVAMGETLYIHKNISFREYLQQLTYNAVYQIHGLCIEYCFTGSL